MTLLGAEARQSTVAIGQTSKYLPSLSFEYLLYVQIFYAVVGSALGISIDLLGMGMLGLVGGMCLMRVGKYATAVLRPVAALLACGVSFVAVQVLAHGESLSSGAVREFIPWMVGLVAFQCLALRRGFLHRFAVAAFLIGLSTLPFMITQARGLPRLGLGSGVSIGNPNDLAAWFGFCCVYFTIVGLETRRNSIRTIAWVIALACLGIVGLTVSRGSLFAVAVSIVIAFRRVLKRGMFPLLCLIVLAWVSYSVGLFEQSAALYVDRGLEETGRLQVWPLAIERFLQSPFAGVGIGKIATYVPAHELSITPHNGFIFIALASGVVPLLFFIWFWVQLFARSLSADAGVDEDAPFRASLLIYSFLAVMDLNMAFMTPWMMAAFASAAGTKLVLKAPRAIAGQASKRRGVPALAGHSRA